MNVPRPCLCLAVCSALLSFSLPAAPLPKLSLSPAQEAKVEALLGSMSLEEKIGQLNQLAGSREAGLQAAQAGQVGSFLGITGAAMTNQAQRRVLEHAAHKIPLLFGLDVIHGFVTSFPIPLAESCSWDLGLAQRCAQAAGLEARAGGLRWTFAPMVDVARDPRWGRILEGAGEDPLLGAAFAAARVRGFQTDRNLAACAKHFVGYGASEAGRDYNSVDLSERRLRDVYYPPFEAGLRAGAATLMSSFNTLNGLPLAADPVHLRGLLKDGWGFDGLVVSDWNSVGELVKHGVAVDAADAARQGLLAGVDVDMAGKNYAEHLADEVKAGRVPAALVDDAARRVLRVKAWLGLLDRPYTDEALAAKVTLSPAHRALARQAAREACVLLKNDGVLPLDPRRLRTLALIGPLADDQDDPLGAWSARTEAKDVVSLRAGLAARLGRGTRLLYAKGCDVTGTATDGFDAALAAAQAADVVLLALGEHRAMSGEPYARTELGLPGVQRDLAQAVMKLGKPTVLLLSNGRPLTLAWEDAHIPAILETWFLGSESGDAIADILLGDFNPQGRLSATFPRSVGQIPIYYAVLPTARPGDPNDKWTSKYLDSPNSPLYPFGYGLSYTRFEYSDLSLPASVEAGGTLAVSVRVANVGARPGVETAQLYLRQPSASVSRPVRELRGFQQVSLKPGASKILRFTLKPADLGLYNRNLDFGLEPGRFQVWVGPDSASGLGRDFRVEGGQAFYPLPGQRPRLAQEQQGSAALDASPPWSQATAAPAPTPAPASVSAAAATAGSPSPSSATAGDTGPAVP